ncbi:MAG: M24 family metallopeptidase [Candidatus Binatia bacterium]
MADAKPGLPVPEVRDYLRERDLDGWLLWDFRGQNPTAVAALGLGGHMLTRRWAYWIPRNEEPALLVHKIEAGSMPRQPGRVVVYAGYQELHAALGRLLAGKRRVAMEYCPLSSIPYLSRVDAGTVELVRSFGIEVVSSADLVQFFLCRLTPWQIESHRRAALAIDRAKDEAYRFIAEGIRAGRPPLETEVQNLITSSFARLGLITDHAPIVAVNEHAADPHYVPRRDVAKRCAEHDLVLIDLWAKESEDAAVFADVTWVAYAGESAPERIAEVFDVVRRARDLGLETVRLKHANGERLEGWMIDRAVRDFIAGRGYGEQFMHRTGHNIGAHADHGDGANLDDFETHDTRALVPGLCFSIEPGIYLEDFGVRSEINVVLEESGPMVYTPAQRELLRLLS